MVPKSGIRIHDYDFKLIIGMELQLMIQELFNVKRVLFIRICCQVIIRMLCIIKLFAVKKCAPHTSTPLPLIHEGFGVCFL